MPHVVSQQVQPVTFITVKPILKACKAMELSAVLHGSDTGILISVTSASWTGFIYRTFVRYFIPDVKMKSLMSEI